MTVIKPVARRVAALVCAVVLGVTGCTSTGGQQPPGNAPKADDTLATLATGVSDENLSHVPLTSDATQATNELTVVVKGMGTAVPTVKPGTITYDKEGTSATGTLSYAWTLGKQPWTYTTSVPLRLIDGTWKVEWSPKVVHPDLTARSRMKATRQSADRGRILGGNGQPLVDRRDVVLVGLDKSQITAAQVAPSARAIAALVNIDEATFVKKAQAAGAKQFVVAVTDRSAVAPEGLGNIPGGLAQNDIRMLSPYKGFAGNLLGTVGEASKERAAKSKGEVQVGDEVGVGGIQAFMDSDLRGTPGVRVDLVERADLPPGESTEIYPVLLWQQKAVAGKDVTTTLDFARQKKVEDLIRTAAVPTGVVVVQPSTGKILAIANSENAVEAEVANRGRNAPGSTFKVVTALAMMRHGVTMDSVAPCPTQVTLNGRRVTNYNGYPTAQNGNITLGAALAYSCNTSFAGFTPKLGAKDLQEAAASLGMGIDYDAGFRSFFGSVPDTTTVEARMEQTFGQGTVTASPLAMSSVPASVAAGRTVVPWLIESRKPNTGAKPLTEAEAAQLRRGMAGVVANNKAKMTGLEGAKTGTAQFGTGPTLQTHIWLIAFKGDLAAAVYQETGAHSADLGPLMVKVLS